VINCWFVGRLTRTLAPPLFSFDRLLLATAAIITIRSPLLPSSSPRRPSPRPLSLCQLFGALLHTSTSSSSTFFKVVDVLLLRFSNYHSHNNPITFRSSFTLFVLHFRSHLSAAFASLRVDCSPSIVVALLKPLPQPVPGLLSPSPTETRLLQSINSKCPVSARSTFVTMVSTFRLVCFCDPQLYQNESNSCCSVGI
jgi:hypothetical protein